MARELRCGTHAGDRRGDRRSYAKNREGEQKLKDILLKNFACPELDKRRLGDVVDLFTKSLFEKATDPIHWGSKGRLEQIKQEKY